MSYRTRQQYRWLRELRLPGFPGLRCQVDRTITGTPTASPATHAGTMTVHNALDASGSLVSGVATAAGAAVAGRDSSGAMVSGLATTIGVATWEQGGATAAAHNYYTQMRGGGG